MPAPVLVVHDEQDIGFADPLQSHDVIENDTRVRVVVTRIGFPPADQIARVLRLKRPDISAIFIARPEDRRFADGIGTFLPLPLDPQALQQTPRTCGRRHGYALRHAR